MMRNKKGAIFTVVIFVVVALLGIYALLYLPIPAFSKIRNLMHYIMIIIVWIVLQIGIIYGYYRLGLLVRRGFYLYKNKLLAWTFKVKSFLITRGR